MLLHFTHRPPSHLSPPKHFFSKICVTREGDEQILTKKASPVGWTLLVGEEVQQIEQNDTEPLAPGEILTARAASMAMEVGPATSFLTWCQPTTRLCSRRESSVLLGPLVACFIVVLHEVNVDG